MEFSHQWLLIIIFVYGFRALTSIAMAVDLYSLVYKGCANGTIGGGSTAQQAIAAVATALIAQSTTSKFYKTTTTSTAGQAFSGRFQCRGDLTPSDCSTCVSKLTPMWGSLCGSSIVAAARVQLTGCYALYEIAGFPQVAATELLFKTCGSDGGGTGFEEKRSTALSSLQSGLSASGGAGFYATSYESVYAMAQCEGDLSPGNCGDCVVAAVEKVEVECGGAASGQVYLDKCYISYSYYPNGVPRGAGAGAGAGAGEGDLGGELLDLYRFLE